MEVTNFSSEQHIIKIPEVQDLLPDKIFTTSCSFVLRGVNNAIANGLRRTISSELLVRAMVAESVETTDEFIIPEMVVERLKMIPILQSTAVSTVFSLHAVNSTGMIRNVYSGEIKCVGAQPFDKNYQICTLRPGKTIDIKKINVEAEYSFMTGCGMMVVASNCICIPLDVTPIDLETREGVSSSLADPREWKLGFTGFGTMSDRDIIIAACKSIIERVNNVRGQFPMIRSNVNEHTLAIEGETDTIGNLFMKTTLDLNPTGVSILYDTDVTLHSLVIRVRCRGDVATILGNTADEIIEIYKTIMSKVKSAG